MLTIRCLVILEFITIALTGQENDNDMIHKHKPDSRRKLCRPKSVDLIPECRIVVREMESGYGSTLNENKIQRKCNCQFTKAYFSGFDVISKGVFKNYGYLTKLELVDNNLTSISEGTFDGLIRLQELNLSRNGLKSIEENAFRGLGKSLSVLDLQDNELTDFKKNELMQLKNLTTLYTDDCTLCNFVKVKQCTISNNTDKPASCKYIIPYNILHVMMWIISIVSFTCNICILVQRMFSRFSNVQTLLISCSATSDIVMSIYVLLITGSNLYYADTYLDKAYVWKHSFLCKFAGSLFTFSCEFSMFVLILLCFYGTSTLIVYPPTWLNRQRCARLLLVGLVFTTFISFLPMLNLSYFDYYYGHSFCSPLPLIYVGFPGSEYAISIFLILNLYGIVAIISMALLPMYSHAKAPESYKEHMFGMSLAEELNEEEIKENIDKSSNVEAVKTDVVKDRVLNDNINPETVVIVKEEKNFEGEEENEEVQTENLRSDSSITPMVVISVCCWAPIIALEIVSFFKYVPFSVYEWSTAFVFPMKSLFDAFFYVTFVRDLVSTEPSAELTSFDSKEQFDETGVMDTHL